MLFVVKNLLQENKGSIQLCKEFAHSFHTTTSKYGQHFLEIGDRKNKQNTGRKGNIG